MERGKTVYKAILWILAAFYSVLCQMIWVWALERPIHDWEGILLCVEGPDVSVLGLCLDTVFHL